MPLRITIVVRQYDDTIEKTMERLRSLGFEVEPWVGPVADLARQGRDADVVLLDPIAPVEHRAAVAALRQSVDAPVAVLSYGTGTGAGPIVDVTLADKALRELIEAVATAYRAGRGERAPHPPAEHAAVPLGYEAFMRYASDAIFIADPTGRYVAANDQALEMVGYSRDELLQLHMRDLTPAEDLTGKPLQFSRLESKRPIFVERRLRRKDGTAFPVELSAVFLPDGNLLGIARDITARKASETRLRESEDRYRQIFNTNPAIKIVIDPESGRIVDANPAACEFYGYSLAALTEKRIFDINDLPEAEVRAELDAAVREKRLYFVFRHRLASGEKRWVEVYSGPMSIDGKQYLHSIVHDITERKNAEAKLIESEQYYRALFENASDLVTIFDANAQMRYVSPSVRRLLGYEPSELLGAGGAAIIHPEDDAAVAAEFAQVANRPGAIVTREMRIRHKDGPWRFFESTATNLLHDPVVKGIIVNSRDITARKRAEEALRERTEELERLNQFMVDRELRMVELKKEIAELRAELAAVRAAAEERKR